MQKFLKSLFFVLCASVFLSSCVFEKNIKFNEDMSGTAELAIDFTEFTQSMGLGEEDLEDKEPKEKSEEDLAKSAALKSAMESIEGISNFREFETDVRAGFSFDFKDVQSLNSAFSNNTVKEKGVGEYFSNGFISIKKKGKKLIYSEDPMIGEMAAEMQKKGEEGGEGSDAAALEQVANMLSVRTTIEFAGGVKSVKSKNGFTKEGNKVVIEKELKEVKEGEKWTAIIKKR